MASEPGRDRNDHHEADQPEEARADVGPRPRRREHVQEDQDGDAPPGSTPPEPPVGAGRERGRGEQVERRQEREQVADALDDQRRDALRAGRPRPLITIATAVATANATSA